MNIAQVYNRIKQASDDANPIGFIRESSAYLGTSITNGKHTWLYCNGDGVSQSSYATLFDRVGHNHAKLPARGWSEVTSNIGANQAWSCAAKPDGTIIVITGNGGTISRSTDGGATWAAASSKTPDGSQFKVAWSTAAECFVCVGWDGSNNKGSIQTSTDGDTWSNRTLTGVGANTLNDLAFDDSGTAVVVGASQEVWYSTDVANDYTSWSQGSGIHNGNNYAVCWHPYFGCFIAAENAAANCVLSYSVDGATWKEGNDLGDPGDGVNGIAPLGQYIVFADSAAGTTLRMAYRGLYSTGFDWYIPSEAFAYSGLRTINQHLFAVGTSGRVYTINSDAFYKLGSMNVNTSYLSHISNAYYIDYAKTVQDICQGGGYWVVAQSTTNDKAYYVTSGYTPASEFALPEMRQYGHYYIRAL